jgi:hypothetical protein
VSVIDTTTNTVIGTFTTDQSGGSGQEQFMTVDPVSGTLYITDPADGIGVCRHGRRLVHCSADVTTAHGGLAFTELWSTQRVQEGTGMSDALAADVQTAEALNSAKDVESPRAGFNGIGDTNGNRGRPPARTRRPALAQDRGWPHDQFQRGGLAAAWVALSR